ncbi:MAG: 16S rRNA (uracil(1498)-N(3))-methyltransferase [Alphaproteobacteria bacterium]|nr:16S rRNA (uracil(1498)-N(3))-methyltransferase [Alphaproteobacteria bacterium]
MSLYTLISFVMMTVLGKLSMSDRYVPRIFVDCSLQSHVHIELGITTYHYLKNVLRLTIGSSVKIFNGSQGEWLGTIENYTKHHVIIKLQDQFKKQFLTPSLNLLFAPIKKNRLDFLVEKATELGVTLFQPMITDYTNTKNINPSRLNLIAQEAAEQCERLDIPKIENIKSLDDVLKRWDKNELILLCAEKGDAKPIQQILGASNTLKKSYQPHTILIGPEGGFSQREMDMLVNQEFIIPVTLGSRILRSETAALAALACWQSNLDSL